MRPRVLRALSTVLLALPALHALLPLDAERLRASVGGYAVMNCHLDFPFGHEIPYHLQWDKDGELVYSWYSGEGGSGGVERITDAWSGRVRRAEGDQLGGGSLNVSSVRETDAGLYRCRVTFPNRSPPTRNNGTFYYLEVDGGDLIVRPPVNATVAEGERAELECAPGSPEWVVQWYREGVPLGSGPGSSIERPPNGSLVLSAAASSDLGRYECRVSSPDDTHSQSASAYLDVHYKAKVVYAPAEVFLPLGKAASLDCHFSANPPLTNLRWEKDGFLFDPYNVPGVFYSRNGSLLFNRVDESHEGQYSCTPYNTLGTQGSSRAVRVRVQRPPALVARPLPLYLARLGASVTLPCTPAPSDDPDEPAPDLRWTRKDGAALPRGRHAVAGGNLTLSELSEEDRGVYVCTVSNTAAAISADTELVLENVPPRAPHALKARAAPRALRLSWVAGAEAEDGEYAVWYRERGAREWRSMRLLSRGTTHATIGGLRPRTEYELRVLSQDRIGDGLFSKPIFVRTLDSEATTESTHTAAPAPDYTDALVSDTRSRPADTDTDAGDEDEDDDVADEEEEGGESDSPLEVSVRLVEEGALVVWRRAPADLAPCTVRWYRNGAELLKAVRTRRDHLLLRGAEEGEQYEARVRCEARGAGHAVLGVPRWGRLRAAAAAAGGGALLLAALGGALFVLRRRRAQATPHKRR